ncbi:MAG: FAD-binding oxidoreductase [Vulcanimicrobiaceae bacterium]
MTEPTLSTLAATATVSPNDLAEATAVMTDAAASNHTVGFVGGGTELGFGYAPTRVDVLVRTTKLDRVVEYQPADMVVEVEAGMTLAALQRTLAPHRQRLALDAPLPERATLGGLVATNAFGPHRTQFGSLRDLIVGVSFVRADGARVRGGGKVVKNVAGFDLPKLAVGSFGSLGMIATATFRLHPVPEASHGRRVAVASAEDVATIARDLFAAQLEPAALVAERADGGAYRVDVLFEGFESGAREQAERFEQLVRARGFGCEHCDADHVARADEGVRAHGNVRVRVAVPPADLARTDRDAIAPLVATLGDARTIVYPALGVAFVSGVGSERPTLVDALLAARRAAEARGGHLVILDTTDALVAQRVDIFGTLPPAFALMRGLKDRFDPSHRLNPGRFLGKL